MPKKITQLEIDKSEVEELYNQFYMKFKEFKKNYPAAPDRYWDIYATGKIKQLYSSDFLRGI